MLTRSPSAGYWAAIQRAFRFVWQLVRYFYRILNRYHLAVVAEAGPGTYRFRKLEPLNLLSSRKDLQPSWRVDKA